MICVKYVATSFYIYIQCIIIVLQKINNLINSIFNLKIVNHEKEIKGIF